MTTTTVNGDVIRVYEGSDGAATKALYARLEQLGPAGVIALNLFRACKCSERAKVYRGRGFKDSAYERKQWSMGNLCKALTEHGAALGMRWGWGIDAPAHSVGSPLFHVLYIETEAGQISFHSDARGTGPDFDGCWDGVRGASGGRACSFAATLLRRAGSAVDA